MVTVEYNKTCGEVKPSLTHGQYLKLAKSLILFVLLLFQTSGKTFFRINRREMTCLAFMMEKNLSLLIVIISLCQCLNYGGDMEWIS